MHALPPIGASRRRRAYAPDEMPADADTFVVLYVDGRPVAGAALGVRADGLADVSRFSAVGPDEEVVSHALLVAVEQTARERG